MSSVALDTSAAIPYVVRTHEAHARVSKHVSQRGPVLTGQSLAETYSVLTRLPSDARVAPHDAARLLRNNFGNPVLLPDEMASRLPEALAVANIAGGAVYDAMVGLSAREAGIVLVTRDRRAAGTYANLVVAYELVA
jgi:toxin FitB